MRDDAPRTHRLSGKVLVDNPRLRLHEDEVTLPSGRPSIHWRIEYKLDGVGVVPILDDGSVLLGLHHRYCTNEWGWEIAAGGVGPGEDHIAAAERELVEETAHRAGRLEYLLDYRPAPGLGNEHFYIYAATELTPTGTRLDPDEIVELRPFFWTEIEELLEDHQIRCGFTLTSLLLCRMKGMIR